MMNAVVLSSQLVVEPEFWYILAGIAVLLWIYFIRIHIAYVMAKHRNREPLPWVLLSVFVSPILTWIILLLIKEEKNETNTWSI